MRTRTAVIAFALALVTGCTWAGARFDRTNSGANPWESAISAVNVGNLTPFFTTNPEPLFFASPTLLVHSNRFFVGGGDSAFARYRAYATDGTGMDCTDSVVPICGPRWLTPKSIDPAQVVEHRLFLGDAAFDASGDSCGGVPVVCTPIWTESAFGALMPGDGTVPFERMHFRSIYVPSGIPLVEAEFLNGYDATGAVGCDHATHVCAPVWSVPITAVGHQWSAGTAVTPDRVYVRTLNTSIQAYNLAGDVVWQTSGSDPVWGADQIVVAGDHVLVIGTIEGETDPRILGFSASGAGCSGVPHTCAPSWRSEPLTGAVTNLAVAGNRVFVTHGSALAGYDLGGASACTGSPPTCTPVFVADLGDGVPTAATIANGVIYVGTDHGVHGYDATGTLGCTGTTLRVCSPRWSALAGVDVLSPAVVAGRVLVPAADGAVHLFTLA